MYVYTCVMLLYRATSDKLLGTSALTYVVAAQSILFHDKGDSTFVTYVNYILQNLG